MSEATIIPAGRDLDGFGAGLYIRKNGPNAKGATFPGHRHYIDHVTFIMAGAVRIEQRNADGSERVLHVHAPNTVLMPASSYHTIKALEDGTIWCCVFSEALGLADDASGTVPYNMDIPE